MILGRIYPNHVFWNKSASQPPTVKVTYHHNHRIDGLIRKKLIIPPETR